MSENQSTKEYIELLKEHCSNSEKEGKFGEAEKTKRRIQQLTRQQERAQIQALEIQHESERAEIEDSHIMEFQEFSRAWEKQTRDKRRSSEEQINLLSQQQEEERVRLLDKLDKELPVKPKHSSEVLNLLRIQEGLVKQKEYGEAKLIKKRIKYLQKRQEKDWTQERNNKIEWKLANLDNQHEIRLHALKLKLRGEEDELEKKRILETEHLLQKYQNVKKGLQNYQITQHNHLSAAATLTSIN